MGVRFTDRSYKDAASRGESKLINRFREEMDLGPLIVTKRPCLRCERKFLSQGPHNRICSSCRQVITASLGDNAEYKVMEA